jgi:predicted site-specific integrase-resolvase
MKITLNEWADLTFGKIKPSLRTMRRWVSEGKLKPSAEKIGRTLYVTPETRFVGMSRGELSRLLENKRG